MVLILAAVGILLTVLIILTYHKQGAPDHSAWYMKIIVLFARCICWYDTNHFPAIEVKRDLPKKRYNNNNDSSSIEIPVNNHVIQELRKHSGYHLHNDIPYKRKMKQISRNNNYNSDVTWKHVALVLDRFCFYVFFATTVMMNVTSVAVLVSGDP